MNLEQINLGYSLKNIPIPSSKQHMKCLIEKVDSFIRRISWKAYFFDYPDSSNSTDNYNFKSERCPPQHDGLIPFENDFYEMIRAIKFRPVCNSFQSMLKQDVKEINSFKTLFVPSDKTTNLCKVNKQDYKKLLLDNVTASNQKIEPSTNDKINLEAKIIATKLILDDRVEALSQRNAFITLKDHNPNFPNSSKCRLINPTKSEIGKISKIILDTINSSIRVNSDLNQWR